MMEGFPEVGEVPESYCISYLRYSQFLFQEELGCSLQSDAPNELFYGHICKSIELAIKLHPAYTHFSGKLFNVKIAVGNVSFNNFNCFPQESFVGRRDSNI